MKADELRREFLKKHRSAHYLVYDHRTRHPIGAIYYAADFFVTPEVHRADLKRFFALCQLAVFERQEEDKCNNG